MRVQLFDAFMLPESSSIMRINIIDDSEAAVASAGRIVEVEDGETVTETCFICDNPPDTGFRVEGSEMEFCCEEHRDLFKPDDQDLPFPIVVKFRPEIGRLLFVPT